MGLEMMNFLIGIIIVITMATMWIWIKNTNGLIKSKKINIPYQSDITGKLIDNLINKRCRLVSYENSSKNHIPLLKTIKSHLSKILKRKLNECPIT